MVGQGIVGHVIILEDYQYNTATDDFGNILYALISHDKGKKW